MAAPLTREERKGIYGRLQMHPRYAQLTPRQQKIVDYFAAGLTCQEVAGRLRVARGTPHRILTNTILPTLKRSIWKQTNNTPAALRLLAKEVNLP